MHPLCALPLLITLLLISSVPLSVQESDAFFRYTNCTTASYQCGSLKLDVDYPFSANGVDRPNYCSYPGYRLICNPDNKLMIHMNSTVFQVTDIDYGNKFLAVIDQTQPQETCPDRYHNTTIDESRFMYTDLDQFLTVYVNCSAKSSSLPFIYDLLSCVSGGSSYYRLHKNKDDSLESDILGSCSSSFVVPFNSTMAGSLAAGNSSLVDVIRGGFTARWKVGVGYRIMFFIRYRLYLLTNLRASQGSKISKKKAIAIGVSVVSGVILLFLLLMCTLCVKKFWHGLLSSMGKSKEAPNIESFLQKHEAQHPKRYSYSEVKTMTKSFSHKLGQGGFGTVYMGKMPNGKPIAVKLLKSCKDDGQEFMNEVASISRTSHVNVVTLLGYCIVEIIDI
uniref:Uncharacterized protein P0560C03.9 n=1 Tax=Oryza sativa subsp. japonica TaxID=39947 RepID=Q6L4G7_ORYSJ|nr:unknown protein [Oryza sativa Japonica Group]